MTLDALLILAAAPLGVWDVLWDILVLLAMALLLGGAVRTEHHRGLFDRRHPGRLRPVRVHA